MANVTQLLSLARQGNAEAIAAIMSRPLHKDGISVQVNRDRSEGLVIAFLGILAPDQRQILGYVKRGLDKLGLSQVEPQVTVEGWAMGESEPEWRSTLPLAAPGALPTAADLDGAKAPKTTVRSVSKEEPTEENDVEEKGVEKKSAEEKSAEEKSVNQPVEDAEDGGAIARATNTAQLSTPSPKPVQPPQPKMNFAELQKIVGQVVETAIQPTVAPADDNFATEALGLDPTVETSIESASPGSAAAKPTASPRQTLDQAFELLEASISQVQSRNLPVEQVAVSTKVDLGPISLEIQLDVPSQGAPRVMKLDVQGDAAALAKDADAVEQNAGPGAELDVEPGAQPVDAAEGEGGAETPAIAEEGEFTQNQAIWSAEEQPQPDQEPSAEAESPEPVEAQSEAAEKPEAEAPDVKQDPLEEARSLLEAKQYGEVIAYLNPLVEAINQWAEAYRLLSAGVFGQGKEPEGLLSLKVARNLYIQQGQMAAALQVDQIFVQRNFNADGPEFEWVVGMVLYNQGKVDEAIAALQKSAQTNPEEPEPLKILGGIFGKQGKLEEGKATLRKAQTLYLKKGNTDAAREIESFLQSFSQAQTPPEPAAPA